MKSIFVLLSESIYGHTTHHGYGATLEEAVEVVRKDKGLLERGPLAIMEYPLGKPLRLGDARSCHPHKWIEEQVR